MRSATLGEGHSGGPSDGAFRAALPVLALLCVLAPTYYGAASGLWRLQEHAYAPMLMALSFGLIAHRARQLVWDPEPGLTAAGAALSGLGAAGYVVGRSQQIELLELGACIALTAGAVAVLGGRDALRGLRFPIILQLLALPLPGWVIEVLTSPLKEWISFAAERLLYAAGYPVARSGVVLALGHYRLLVADACSGLHSLIFLVALGMLYVNLTGHRGRLHWVLLVAALIPIAVLANLVRVILLLLITFHFGDTVGQGYWHDLAGLVLFVSGFAMLTALDAQIARLAGTAPNAGARSDRGRAPLRSSTPPGWRLSLALSVLLLGTAVTATLLPPSRMLAERRALPSLENSIPTRFGDWRTDDSPGALPVAPDLQASVERLYAQTLSRTYVNREGQRIMISVVYGDRQLGNELQAHRPEYCYRAQGFSILAANDRVIPTPFGDLPARRLVARRNNRIEPITYWMTVGDTLARPGMERKLAQLRYGLRGVIPDGMLVRVSSLNNDAGNAFRLHDAFITELQQALPESLRAIAVPGDRT